MTSGFYDRAQVFRLPDGKRLAMRHGPIELIVEADGDPAQVRRAYQQASREFQDILTDLVSELDNLRRPVGSKSAIPKGVIASRMYQMAYTLSGENFVTPMIAVAGAVADHVLSAMTAGTCLDRAYVNNGGDIAFHLSRGFTFDIGLCANPETGEIQTTAHIGFDAGINGVATSGWRGRSYSLGIADAVTVLACDGATADTAATLIANAINLPGHPAISRAPANKLSPDCDLRDRPVTIDVGYLGEDEVEAALCKGRDLARQLIDQGAIVGVVAALQGKIFKLPSGRKMQSLDFQTQQDFDPVKEVFYA